MRSPFVLLLFTGALLSFGACARDPALGPLAAGVAAASEDRWDEAVQYWQKALALTPDSAAVHNNLAVAFEKRGAWEDARREYEEALRLQPVNAEIKANYEAFKVRFEAARKKTP